MLDKMSDASRIVERLRVKGLVERQISSFDKRAVEISITEKGMNLLHTMQPAVDTIEDLFKGYSDDELVTFNEMLDKIRS